MAPPPNPTDRPRPTLFSARTGVLVAGLAVVLTALFFRGALGQQVTSWGLLANDAPSLDALRDHLQDARNPDQAILAAWNTGKIVHRQAAIRVLAGRSPEGPALPAELETILLIGALDPDLNVREAALGGLRYRRHPLATALAGTQLQDLDPHVRLLGLHHLKTVPPGEGLPLVAPLAQDPDLRVAGTAIKMLEHWSEENFDVKIADIVEVTDPQTGVKDYKPEGLARMRAAVERATAWWRQHRTEYPQTPPRLPPTLTEALRPLPAGDFKLDTLEGRTIRLSDLRGKVVLLNFWTTWCTACLVEIPALVELQERHGDRLAVLGISLDSVPDTHGHVGGHGSPDLEAAEDEHEQDHAEELEPTLAELRAKVARTAKKLRINYPVLLDENNVVGGRFNGGELPTTLIIDPEGIIRRRFVGTRTREVFEAMIAEAAQPQPAAKNK